MRHSAFLLVLALALAPVSAGAQDSGRAMGLEPSLRLSQAVLEVWDEDRGLPQSTVRALLQSPDGYIWIGTQEGLVRFNGREFKTYDRSTSRAFVGGHGIRSLWYGDGAIWVGSQGSGLLRFVDGELVRGGLPEEFDHSNITAIHGHPDGSVWASTFGEGLVVIGPDGPARRIVEGLPNNYVTSLEIDPDGTVWAGTKGGLAHIDGSGTTTLGPESGLPDAEILSILRTQAGLLYVGTRGGLVFLDGDGFVPASQAADQAVVAHLEDRFGTHWLGTEEQGIVRLSWAESDKMNSQLGLTSDRISAIMEDQEGSVWVGTDGGGLNRLRPAKFEGITEKEGLGSNMTYGVWTDADGRIWVGSEDAGLTILDGRTSTVLTTDDGLSSNTVMTFGQMADGSIWAGTFGDGLNRISADGITHLTTEDGLVHDVVSSITASADGGLWIGTDGGISHFDGGVFKNIRPEDGLPSPYVMAVHESADGAVWAGTYDAGLVRIDGDEIASFGRRQGLSVDMVLAIHETADGSIWAGSYGGGLLRVNDGEVAILTTQHGLYDDVIFGIVEDEGGLFWMTSNKGLFSVARADLEAVIDGRSEKLVSARYGKEDGLRTREFNGGFQPAAWKAQDGRMVFPSTGGIVVLDPHSIPVNTVAPQVHIESVLVDADERLDPNGVTVSTGRIEFLFAGLSYLVPKRVRYRYQLQGYDQDWTVTADPKAVYTNLPDGAFTFRVQAANNDGVWSSEGTAISVVRHPRFWETSWFQVLALMSFLGLVWLGVRVRLRALRARQVDLERTVQERTRDLREEKEKVEDAKSVIEAQAAKLQELDRFKTRFFANVSHEFRTPLTMIVGPLENALSGSYGALSADMRRQASIMLRNARRLLRLINQLLDLSKLESGKMRLQAGARDLVAFLENLHLTVHPLAEDKRIELPFEAPAHQLPVFFEPDKMEKVFYNLLSNALKFTPKRGKVGITVQETDTEVAVTIWDTGRGIPEADLPHVFDRFHQVDGSNTREFEGTGIGLALVKEMVMLHGGSVAVTSKMGEGTQFTVTLLKGADHLSREQLGGEPDSQPDREEAKRHLLEADLPVAPLGSRAGWSAVSSTAPLVLVVEDNPDVRTYVAEILEGADFRTTLAVDGVDGLEKARLRTPHLIVSDVMMPRMDGTELCRQVKRDQALKHVPVILLTARASSESQIESLKAGADDYLAKPFNQDELLARVANLIKNQEDHRRLADLTAELNERVAEQVGIILEQRKVFEGELIAERDRAKVAAKLKQNILDNMSHEFRTPLTGIMGYVELLSAEAEDPEMLEFVNVIRTNGNRLVRTLDGLIRMAHLQAEREGEAKARINLSNLVRQKTEEYQPAAKEGRLSIESSIAESVHCTVAPVSLADALDAILDNAFKFTRVGSVHVGLEVHEDTALIRVSDTGVGIPEGHLDAVFEPFKQASEGLSRTFEGSGLGLSIAKHLIELQGGTVTLTSKPAAGTCVEIRLNGVLPSLPGGSKDRPPRRPNRATKNSSDPESA